MKQGNACGVKEGRKEKFVNNSKNGRELSTVSKNSNQERKARYRQFAEPSVWNAQMLAALDNGVKGGKWFSLIDKTFRVANLKASWKKVSSRKSSPGTDGVTISQFEGRLEQELKYMQSKLRSGEYMPGLIKRINIPKSDGKSRPLGIPTLRDRVIQGAVKNVLEPIFEKEFCKSSFGFRPGLGCKDALRKVESLLKSGYNWVLDADIRGFFDAIDHEILIQKVQRKISDGKLIELITKYLKQGILEGTSSWSPEKGTPQGAVLSPLLANIYLHDMDMLMENMGFNIVRYADDFVILCRSEYEAKIALKYVEEYMNTHKLKLHDTKTKIIDARDTEGFDFLGYNFSKGTKKWPSKKSLKKFKNSVRWYTKRKTRYSMKMIIERLTPLLRGWFEYFKHCHKYLFAICDSWIRRRLRSVLLGFNKKGVAHGGFENMRWPNAYFAKMNLFSLEEAHKRACKSLSPNIKANV